jgi:hypothetical protein
VSALVPTSFDAGVERVEQALADAALALAERLDDRGEGVLRGEHVSRDGHVVVNLVTGPAVGLLAGVAEAVTAAVDAVELSEVAVLVLFEEAGKRVVDG